MANASNELSALRMENRKLKAENKRLEDLTVNKAAKKPRMTKNLLRKTSVVFFLGLAVALLLVGNILFWTGNTIVKTDRYEEATAPIIRNSAVQTAISSYATDQLFKNVDVNNVISEALPPRADFLAPTISDQLKSHTQGTLQKILANPNFQQKWNEVQKKSHDRFIATVEKNGSDGVISVNELYQQLSGNLKNTKLSFLANKPLPAKIGSVQVAKGEQIRVLNKVITHIDRWRTLAVLLFLASAAAGIYLSRKHRKAVVLLSLYSVVGMFATLITLRITREVIAGKVDAKYSEAVRQTLQIFFHPLVIQTVTILCLFAVVAFIAWVSGSSKSASFFKARTSDLLAGKLHRAVFGAKETSFTLWLGKYKRYIEWTMVGIIALIALLIRLTPKALILCAFLIFLLILVVEMLAAPTSNTKRA
jgi:chromosome condensin MukBEF MukE localization factor